MEGSGKVVFFYLGLFVDIPSEGNGVVGNLLNVPNGVETLLVIRCKGGREGGREVERGREGGSEMLFSTGFDIGTLFEILNT